MSRDDERPLRPEVEYRIAESINRMIAQGWPVGEAIVWAVEYWSPELWAVST